MVKITKLPSGEALGARDLQNWSASRMTGSSRDFESRKKVPKMEIHCLDCRHETPIQMTEEMRRRAKFKCPTCNSKRIRVLSRARR